MCDHDHSDGDYDKLLLEAARANNPKCIITLMDKGAEVDWCAVLDILAEHHENSFRKNWARYNTSVESTVILIVKDKGTILGLDILLRMAFVLSASHGLHHWLQSLIDLGQDVNFVYPGDTTALMLAAGKGHIDCVNALLEAGANVNAQATDGMTALSSTAIMDRVECLESLLRAGADVDMTSYKGRQP